MSSWIPAVAGLTEKLSGGVQVADVGCGLGASSRILATVYPASSVIGFDSHPRSIELERVAAASAGLTVRRDFAGARAQDYPGTGYGLAATFDCLHHIGDPIAAATHIRESLADDGVWLIVEPYAGESIADKLNPVGQVYYSFSTFLCVPHAVSEGAGDALGNQAGEAAIRSVLRSAGFGTFRRVAETGFNVVYEARLRVVPLIWEAVRPAGPTAGACHSRSSPRASSLFPSRRSDGAGHRRLLRYRCALRLGAA